MGTVIPQRIQLRRTKGWRKPEGAIVVARPSKWGNPYRWVDYRTDYPEDTDNQLRWMATSDFRGMVLDTLIVGGRGEYHYPSVETIRAQLRGHDLACWCPLSSPCHADELLRIANEGAIGAPET